MDELNSQILLKDPQVFFRELLLQRKLKNRSYSARALARDLGVSQSFLSQLLTGNRKASLEQKLKFADLLGLEINFSSDDAETPATEVLQQTQDHEKILKYWYHFAILELSKTTRPPNTPLGIAKRIGISELEAKTAIDRLIQFGYLKFEKKKYVVTGLPFIIDGKKSTQALREFHQTRIQAAGAELESFDEPRVNQRVFQTLFVSSTKAAVKEANDLVYEFQKKLLNILVKEKGDEVFQLSLQLFSIEQNTARKSGNSNE